MTNKLLLRGSALALSAALALPLAATAQVTAPVTSIASASPADSIFSAKAWNLALTQMDTTYKPQMDQIKAKLQQRQDLLAQLDTNKDKQVDDAELQAAVTANSPTVTQISQLEREIQPLDLQVRTAQAYVLDTIAERYKTALQNVIRDRKISIVLTPDAFIFKPPATDITSAVTAEVDRILPSAAVTPPPNWQVTPQGAQWFEQWQQLQQAAQQQAAQQQAAAGRPAGTPPAVGAAPAAAAPRPTTPAAGAPARGSAQQPATR